MTGIVAWKQDLPEPSVHIATDSLTRMPDGQPTFAPKVLTLPHLGAAMVVQGVGAALPHLVQEVAKTGADLKRIVQIFPSLVQSVREIAHDAAHEAGASPEFVAILGGVEPDGTAHLVFCVTHPVFGYPPFQAIDSLFVPMPGSPAIVEAMQLPDDGNDIQPADAVRFVRAQRDGDIVNLDGRSARDLIGGPVVWTGIYRDRIEQRVVGVV